MGPSYKDYYATLGVSKTATEKEIKAVNLGKEASSNPRLELRQR